MGDKEAEEREELKLEERTMGERRRGRMKRRKKMKRIYYIVTLVLVVLNHPCQSIIPPPSFRPT